jgi:hypothetical protein
MVALAELKNYKHIVQTPSVLLDLIPISLHALSRVRFAIPDSSANSVTSAVGIIPVMPGQNPSAIIRNPAQRLHRHFRLVLVVEKGRHIPSVPIPPERVTGKLFFIFILLPCIQFLRTVKSKAWNP